MAIFAGPGVDNTRDVSSSVMDVTPTLLYTAWPHRHSGAPIRACLPLGRGRVAVAAYAVEGDGLRLEWLRNLRVEDAVEPGPVLYCGELESRLRALVEAAPRARTVGAAEGQRNPAVLAELAWDRLTRGDTDDPASLQAEYLERADGGGFGT
jgi:tRNA threonylcarbamoyladenosine biosynthesis protein TsaB